MQQLFVHLSAWVATQSDRAPALTETSTLSVGLAVILGGLLLTAVHAFNELRGTNKALAAQLEAHKTALDEAKAAHAAQIAELKAAHAEQLGEEKAAKEALAERVDRLIDERLALGRELGGVTERLLTTQKDIDRLRADKADNATVNSLGTTLVALGKMMEDVRSHVHKMSSDVTALVTTDRLRREQDARGNKPS